MPFKIFFHAKPLDVIICALGHLHRIFTNISIHHNGRHHITKSPVIKKCFAAIAQKYDSDHIVGISIGGIMKQMGSDTPAMPNAHDAIFIFAFPAIRYAPRRTMIEARQIITVLNAAPRISTKWIRKMILFGSKPIIYCLHLALR